MKKVFLLLFSSLPAISAFSQTNPPFNAAEYIEISNIRARHMMHGDMWWDPGTGVGACEYPKGSGRNVSAGGALWIAGYDPQQNLHVSAQTYRQDGNDYWPGPIDQLTNTTTYATEQDWAQIWKVNRSTIDSFRSLHALGLTFMPDVIKEWPAKGNHYAKGTSGSFLTIVETSGRDFAPFVDVNSDGVYDAADGDYPDIKGDQMLWRATNDAGTTHNASGGSQPFGIEIHNSAYAYHRGGAIDNVIFYEYKIINRSAVAYDSLRIGLWADLDIGISFNDFIGYDSTRRMGVCYNALPMEGNYGTAIPMAGVAMMESPTDGTASVSPASSFSYYQNQTNGTYKNPQTTSEFNNLLSPAFTDGTQFANGRKYAIGLSEACDSSYSYGDLRFIIATKSQRLISGAMVKIGFALVVCPNAGGCPNMSFSCLQATADTAFTVYHHPLAPTKIADVNLPHPLHLYPNPAQNHLYFQSANGRNDGLVEVFDAAGKSISVAVKRGVAGIELDVSALPAGVYHIMYGSADSRERGTFVKR